MPEPDDELSIRLQPFFKLEFDKLPPDLRPLVARHYIVFAWNDLNPTSRRDGALRWQSLTAVLDAYFSRKFDRLPARLRPVVTKLFHPWQWQNLSPARRRNVATQWDLAHHPGLARERDELWEKLAEIDEWERRGSQIPSEKWTKTDAKTDKNELAKLRSELIVREQEAVWKAELLGLASPSSFRSETAAPDQVPPQVLPQVAADPPRRRTNYLEQKVIAALQDLVTQGVNIELEQRELLLRTVKAKINRSVSPRALRRALRVMRL